MMISRVHAAGPILGRDLDAETKAGAVIADPSWLSAWVPGFDPLNACCDFGAGAPTASDDLLADPIAVE